jgi:hypothetical protein
MTARHPCPLACAAGLFLFGLFASGCRPAGDSTVKEPPGYLAEIDAALERTAAFYRDHDAKRINLDDVWLFQLAARLHPPLLESPMGSIEPRALFPGHAIHRLFDATWRPDNLVISPASPQAPGSFPEAAYHISAPHHQEIFLPRDEVLLKAMYCRDFGYDAADLERLLATITSSGDYDDTHALVSLLIVKLSECQPANRVEPPIASLIENIVQAQNNAEAFNDLYVERVAFLYWAGAGHRVNPEWIATILERQLENGGWEPDGSPGANLHQTALASLSLLYFKEQKSAQPFYGLFPRP